MGALAGKVAIITGAGSGIGRASAKRFAAEGAKLVIGDKTEAVFETAKMVEEAGGTVTALQIDAGVEADVAAHAGEGAAAHETGAGHDEQALEVVLPAAVLHHPARAFVVQPLGLAFGKGRGILIDGELVILMRDELRLA